eukprot:6541354-Ditylum_brightwellii.AAC.1
MMSTQQSAMIGVQINDEDSTISRDWRWGDMAKLNALCLHGEICAKINVQRSQQSSGVGAGTMSTQQ